MKGERVLYAQAKMKILKNVIRKQMFKQQRTWYNY
nr:unnamed protein product [Callosobruchus analis]